MILKRLGAVIAVFHDVLIVLGIFSILYKFMPFDMEIGQSFIAAILTVVLEFIQNGFTAKL